MAEFADEGDGRPTFPVKALRAQTTRGKTAATAAMRREGARDAAFHRIEEELDLAACRSGLAGR
jgi:hypothetical protein